MMTQETDCPDCEGTGTTVDHITILMTRDAALEAGDPKLEGSEMRIYYEKNCSTCGGSGRKKKTIERGVF